MTKVSFSKSQNTYAVGINSMSAYYETFFPEPIFVKILLAASFSKSSYPRPGFEPGTSRKSACHERSHTVPQGPSSETVDAVFGL
jgi:hypothetical protein